MSENRSQSSPDFGQVQAPTCRLCGASLEYDLVEHIYLCPKCSEKQSSQFEPSGPGTETPTEIVAFRGAIARFGYPEYEKRISDLEKAVDQVNAKLDELTTGQKEEVVLRSPALKDALPMIMKYINENPGCRTSEIILNLQLDPDTVLKAIRTLRAKGEIRSEEIV